MTTWLTQTEAAAHLRMTTGTFRNYLCKGFFPYYVHPDTGTKRFKAADLDASMELVPAKQPEKPQIAGNSTPENIPGDTEK